MLTTVLYSLLGYCIFMWVLVFCLAVFTEVLRGAHPAILLWAPLLPPMFVVEKFGDARDTLRRHKFRRVARAIVRELRKNGITVQGEFGTRKRGIGPDDTCVLEANGFAWLGDGCEIFADVPLHQYQTYGAVFANAIRKFPKLTPRQICEMSYPKEPLDRRWAQSHNLTEYFAKEYYVPCADCGVVEEWHSLVWGDDRSHAQGWAQHQQFYFKDKPKEPRNVIGHICKTCSTKMQWSGASGGALFKEGAR